MMLRRNANGKSGVVEKLASKRSFISYQQRAMAVETLWDLKLFLGCTVTSSGYISTSVLY